MLKNLLKYKLSSLNFSNQIKEFEHKQFELNNLQDEISEWNNKSIKIQSNFDFVLPNYIIDEILENENTKNYFNLHYLINCAVINGRITEDNGKLLKKIYC